MQHNYGIFQVPIPLFGFPVAQSQFGIKPPVLNEQPPNSKQTFYPCPNFHLHLSKPITCFWFLILIALNSPTQIQLKLNF